MEDDEGLSRLMQRRLARLGYEVDVAGHGAQGLEMLHEQEYAAAIIDYRMPGMDGLEVLRQFRVRDIDIPAVMVTGAGDESVAVEAMKLGAGDYLVKDGAGRYFEILPAILNRLFEQRRLLGEKARMEQQLAEKTALLATTLANIDQGVSLFDADLRLTTWNQRYVDLFDLPSDLAKVGSHYGEFLRLNAERGEYGPGEVETLVALRQYPGRLRAELRHDHHRRDGRIIEVRSTPIVGGGFVATYTDVTENKRAEEEIRASEAKYRAVLDTTAQGYWMVDPSTQGTVEVNDALCTMLGYGEEELLGRSPVEFVDADHHRPVPDALAHSSRADQRSGEMVFRAKSGREVHARVTATMVKNPDGSPRWSFAFITDITDHRRAEEEVRRLGHRNQLILDTAGEGIFGIDTKGTITFANQVAARITGWERNELIGRNAHEAMHHTCANGQPYPHEDCPIIKAIRYRYPARVVDEIFWRHDGTWFPVEYVATPIEDDGDVQGAVVVFSDITARKQVEDDLKFSKELADAAQRRLADAIESISEGFALWNADDRLVLCNSRFREFYSPVAERIVPGITYEDLTRLALREGLHADALGREEDWLKEQLAFHRDSAPPHEMHLNSGLWLRVSDHGTADGGIVGIRADITELKERERAVADSEARKSAILEAAFDCIITVDRGGAVLEFNPAAEKTFGYRRKDVLGCNIADLIVPPEARERHRRALTRYLATGEATLIGSRVEVDAMHADGSTFPVELAITPVILANQTLFTAYLRDITERRQAEERLRESEERYRQLFEGCRAVELITDPESGAIVDANAAAASFYGYAVDELESMTISDLSEPSPEETRRELDRARQDGRGHSFQGHRLASGEVRDVEVHMGPVTVGGRQLDYAIIHDITERRKAEQALRESERRFRDVAGAASDWFWEMDETLRFTYISDRFFEAMKVRPEAVLGRTRQDIIGEAHVAAAASTWQAHLEDLASHRPFRDFTYAVTGDDGRTRYMVLAGVPVLDDEGQFLGYRGTGTDITDLKLAEEAIRRSQESFSAILDSIDAMVYVADMETHELLFLNRFGRERFGEQVIGKKCWRVLQNGQEGPCDFCTNDQLRERDGRASGVLVWEFQNSATGRWYECRDQAIGWIDGRMVRLEVAVDITDRLKTQEKIRHMASHDGLTDLPNRYLFRDRLVQALKRAQRNRSKVAVLFVDLDGFKPINDTLGHEVGDVLLKETSRRLRGCVRQSDTVGRHGGDEFTIVLADIHNVASATRVAEQVLEALGSPFHLGGQRLSISASIGIAFYPDHGDAPEDLLNLADDAMYVVKQSGRNGFRVASPSTSR